MAALQLQKSDTPSTQKSGFESNRAFVGPYVKRTKGKNIWASITRDITKKLSLSMPKKLQTVKVANGYHTKY